MTEKIPDEQNFPDPKALAFSLAWNQYQPNEKRVRCSDGTTLMNATTKLIDRPIASVFYLQCLPVNSSGNFILLCVGLAERIISWTFLQNELKLTQILIIPAGVVSIDYLIESSPFDTVADYDVKICTANRTETTEEPAFTKFMLHLFCQYLLTFSSIEK